MNARDREQTIRAALRQLAYNLNPLLAPLRPTVEEERLLAQATGLLPTMQSAPQQAQKAIDVLAALICQERELEPALPAADEVHEVHEVHEAPAEGAGKKARDAKPR